MNGDLYDEPDGMGVEPFPPSPNAAGTVRRTAGAHRPKEIMSDSVEDLVLCQLAGGYWRHVGLANCCWISAQHLMKRSKSLAIGRDVSTCRYHLERTRQGYTIENKTVSVKGEMRKHSFYRIVATATPTSFESRLFLAGSHNGRDGTEN